MQKTFMKKILIVLTLLGINVAVAQVKIGDNPDTIDPASLVELESTNKAFVLSRVTSVQMNAISPLRGALVYNTDASSVFLYDGTSWNSLSSGSGGTVVTDNGDGTFTVDAGSGGNITFNGANDIVTTLVDNGDSTFTYTNENNVATTISVGGTDDDITGVTFDGTNLTVNEGTTSFSADLSALEESADIAVNSTAIGTNTTDIATNTTNIGNNTTAVAANTTDIGNNTTAIGTNTTGIANNVTNIGNNTTAIGTNTTNITTNATNIGNNTTAIGTNTADIATNVTNIGNNTTAIGTNTTNIATINGEQTVQDAAIALNTAKVGLTPAQAVILANTSGTNTGDQDISTDGTAGNISLSDGSTLTLNVEDGDSSATNEINTGFAVNGLNLEITDSNGTLQVPLTAISTDNQNATEVLLSPAIDIDGDGTAETDVQEALEETAVQIAAFAATTDDDVTGVVLSAGSTLTILEGATSVSTDLSALEESGDIAANTLLINNHVSSDLDIDPNNETNTAFASAVNTLTITDPNGALTAPIVNTNALSIVGGNITSTINGVASTAIALPVADGTETEVTGAGINVVTGNGSAATPYVVTATEVDGSVSNETNTAFASAVNTLTITDPDGALTAPIVNSNALSIAGGNITSTINGVASTAIALPVADGTETEVTGAGIKRSNWKTVLLLLLM